MRVPRGNSTSELEVKMTPMIDVVFLLLVFFVWTSSFEIPEFDLPGAVAETPSGGASIESDTPPPVEAFDELIIRLRHSDGTVSMELGGDAIDSVQALKTRIAEVVGLGVQPPVIVDPDPNVSMKQAVSVYDAAREAGADRVMFALEAEG